MIKSVRLQNFRSYTDKTFVFEPGVNAIIGPNGVGKTNILEAIYVTITGSSWRVKDELLIKHNQDWARVDVVTNKHTYTLKLDNRSGSLQKTRYIDDKESRDNFIPVVLFEPDFIRVLTDGPDLRRNWVDGIIAQLKPGYAQIVAGYKRALSQRNALLKRNQVDTHHIFVWNLKLTEYGAQIAHEREKIVSKLNKELASEYRKISGGKESVSASYRPTFGSDYAGEMLKALQQNLPRDSQLGFTTVGPHREDLALKIRKKDILETASKGELKSLSLALKNIEKLVIGAHFLLYDDVSTELDVSRQKNVGKNNSIQNILTTVSTISTNTNNTINL